MMNTDIITYFLKTGITSLFVAYTYYKFLNHKNVKSFLIILLLSPILASICTVLKFYINSFLAIIILCYIQGCLLGVLEHQKLGYSIVLTSASYAISTICQVLSVIIMFIPYRIFKIYNDYLNLIGILLLQFTLLYFVLKIRRFKSYFDDVHKRLDNEFADVIMINISTAIILVACLLGTIMQGIEKIRINLLISFIILSFTMVTLIQKTLKMYYKQKLMTDTINNYEKQINDQNLKIEKLSNEKYKISEVLHKFYNRQEALEMAVNDEKLKKNIHCLTEEFSKEISAIKGLDEIPKADILEIDNMFKYMQNECYLNKIGFNLSIDGNIHYLVNNIIAIEKLETLIGDHLRDAINAVNKVNIGNKEIFAILGVKDGKYELCILDTGVDFDIDTILKLGKQRVTTCDNGNGIGFMTTFETMKETKASLIITENAPNEDRYYTKSVTIRFDNKFKYIVNTYRAKEMKTLCKRDDIIINKI